jgi:hypothetical protein
MLTGKLPFVERDVTRLLYQIVHGQPSPLRQLRPDLDPALEAIVQKAMARQPADRFADARQLATALRHWLSTTSTAILSAPPLPLTNLPPEEASSPAFRSRRRRWSRRAACLLLVGGLAVGGTTLSLLSLRNQQERGDAPRSVEPQARFKDKGERDLKPIDGWIDVRVWKRDDLKGPGTLLKPAVLPLQADDEVRVEAKLNQSAYLYVVWIDTGGKATPIYPWNAHWQWPTRETPVDHLSLPSTPGNRWPIKLDSSDKPGMETLLLLARETPWPRDVELRTLLVDLPRPALQDPASAVWFRNWDVVHDEADRGPNLFDERRAGDPVMRTQQILRERLLKYCDFSRAVSFANAGK